MEFLPRHKLISIIHTFGGPAAQLAAVEGSTAANLDGAANALLFYAKTYLLHN
jgi:hypothetical protein